MRLCYILLSPTFGMHQYTADLANRMSSRHQVDLVTSRHAPGDRYGPAVTIHRPVNFTNTGLSPRTLRLDQLAGVWRLLRRLRPDVVHFTGPHLWNGPLAGWLRRRGVRVIHTIHDLNAHAGRPLGSLLGLWNRSVMARVDTVVVHGQRYHQQLLDQGLNANKLYYLPLLHLFLSYEWEQRLSVSGDPLAVNRDPSSETGDPLAVNRDPSSETGNPLSVNRGPSSDYRIPITDYRSPNTDDRPSMTNFLLFFGRLELYKGVADLLAAYEQVAASGMAAGIEGGLVLAGPGALPGDWQQRLPAGVDWRSRLIGDEEAIELFQNCRALVLPYIDATQSALVAAAYFFNKPVIVTRSGALPEYVQNGRTGLIVPASDPDALAGAMRYALTHQEEMARMGAAGRSWYNHQRQQETNSLCQLYNEEQKTINEKRKTINKNH
jgi:glycosyltransferase involved in cell wall biosynthesis